MTTPATIAARTPAPFRVEFATRIGGVSEGAFASLNLGLLTDDEPRAVFQNRERLLAGLGVDAARGSMCRQVHGNVVTQAEPTGIDSAREHPVRDGVWTEGANEPVVVLSADCVPIALCRPGRRPAVAAVHAGWKGLLAGVIEAGVAALASAELHASIGPAIGPCCYEVGMDVAERFGARFGRDVVRDRQLDLPLAARRALEALGVREIETIDACTACDEQRFFSHRRDNGRTGRQGLVAFIEKAAD